MKLASRLSSSFFSGTKTMIGLSSVSPGVQRSCLADVPIQRKRVVYSSIGFVIVFFPEITEFEVSIRARQPIEELRASIEEKICISIKNYYVVCKKGIVKDGHTIDDYGIEQGSDILLIEKNAKNSEHSLAMKQWIKNREFRRSNPTSKIIFPLQPADKPKPKKVKRQMLESATIDELDAYLKSVKLGRLL